MIEGGRVEPFRRDFDDGPAVRGFLDRPASAPRATLVLAHGASGSARAPLLVALARAFAGEGLAVLRCDLPYRQRRASGPPAPATAAADREGLRRALRAVRSMAGGPAFLGGISYGGRQASMLAAEDPALADGLVLMSYPLHPPGRADAPRTAHFPALRTRALFVHGSRDPFGSLDELRAALQLVPAVTRLITIDGAGHDLGAGRRPRQAQVVSLVVEGFRALFEGVLVPAGGP